VIRKFKTISGIDGLEEFVWTGSDLRQHSLIYGWNGTGKTTMSNILYCLEDMNTVEFPELVEELLK
jgi:wobble nucleotide-excising tRNase